MRQGGFAESGGTEKEEMIEGFLPPYRRFDEEFQTVDCRVLADELIESPRTEYLFQLKVFIGGFRRCYPGLGHTCQSAPAADAGAQRVRVRALFTRLSSVGSSSEAARARSTAFCASEAE